jgi:hypothetical protein
LPERPLRYAPILVGTWLVAGLVVLLTVRRASNMPLLPLDSANENLASAIETAALAGNPRQGI